MIYINAQGEYPRHIGDVQLEKDGFTEGDELPKGWKAVIETEPPIENENQIVYDSGPVEIDGVLHQGWSVRELTEEEIARRDSPTTAKTKLLALGLTEDEIFALSKGIVQ